MASERKRLVPVQSFARDHWRAGVGVLLAIALYAAAGFLLAPWLVKRQLVSGLSEVIRRPVQVERVAVNPFALTLEIDQLGASDAEGNRLIGFDRLFVNAQLSSLVHWAATLAELQLAGPYVRFVRNADASTNWDFLLEEDAKAPPGEDGSLPRLLVRNLVLSAGLVDFEDRTLSPPFATRLGPVGVALQGVSTLPDDSGAQAVVISTEDGARLSWSGTLSLNPLASSGHLELRGSQMPLAYRYLKTMFVFELAQGKADADADYHLALPAGAKLAAGVENFSAKIRDVVLRADEQDILQLPELTLAGGRFDLASRRASLESLELKGASALAWRNADGTLSVGKLLRAQTPSAAPEPTAQEPGLAVSVDRVKLADASLQLEDRSVSPAARAAVNDLDLTLSGVSTEPGTRAKLAAQLAFESGGTAQLAGELGLLPDLTLSGTLQLGKLSVALAQPYVAEVAHVEIQSGDLDAKGELAVGPDEPLSYHGTVDVAELAVRDTLKHQSLVGWRALSFEDLSLSLAKNAVEVSRVKAVRPYARIRIAQDQSTNLDELMVEAAPAKAASTSRVEPTKSAEPAEPEEPLALSVGRVDIQSATVDFADLSLPLPFAAKIEQLGGRISALSTASRAPARVKLEGRVGEFGSAQVSGEILPQAPDQHADLAVLFRNVEMTTLTPYTIKFAGHEIASGKLDLDLHYKVDKRQLQGQNRVVMNQLELGKKVESPDAADLPISLALSLLKDANGVIDLDLPVSGSMDDPQFSIGGLVWKVIVNVITKAVTAPFRLLASLVGIDSEDFGAVAFEPGRAELSPPEQEKIAKLVEALAKRPTLTVKISGATAREADRAALQAAQLDARVEQGLAGKRGGEAKLTERTREVLEELYEQAFPDASLDTLQARFEIPGERKLIGKAIDEVAYADELRKQLVAHEPVGDDALAALAQARADAIAAELAARGLVADRVARGDAHDVKLKDERWVQIELEVAA
jgi:outer membrane protein OmpA-like peptidoglycan-associated protein